MKYFCKPTQLGFTLIELLVVIAILGVLAGGVLVAINPLEQLARGRDAGRKTTVDQLGRAIQSYYTSQSAVYPATGVDWMTTIRASGELKTLPTNPSGGGNYQTGCNGTATFGQNGYCYDTDGVDAIVYTRAESNSSYTSAAVGGCNPATDQAWIVWSSAEGKTGLLCIENNKTVDPSVGVTGLR